VNEGISHTYPAEKPTENRQDGHSFAAMSAGDIYSVSGKVSGKGIPGHGFVVGSTPAPRSNFDWLAYLIPDLLESVDQEETYGILSTRTITGKFVTIEIGA